MRQILFKAKQCGTGLWLFGNVAGYAEHGDGEICFLNDTMFNGQMITRHCDPETVCQYTGLKDADGERIFEGDILMYSSEDMHTYLIAWKAPCFRYILIRKDRVGKVHYDINMSEIKEMRITGNVHDPR